MSSQREVGGGSEEVSSPRETGGDSQQEKLHKGTTGDVLQRGRKDIHKSYTQVAVTSSEPPEETALTTSGSIVVREN